MNCSNCGFKVNENEKFCPNCGSELLPKVFCPNCGGENVSDAKFCDKCGTKLALGSSINNINKSTPASNSNKSINKRSIIYIALIAVALLMILFIGRCVRVGRMIPAKIERIFSGEKPSPSGLEEIVEDFFNSIFEADLERAFSYVSKSAKDDLIDDLNMSFDFNANNLAQLENMFAKLFQGANFDITDFGMEDGSVILRLMNFILQQRQIYWNIIIRIQTP